MTTLQHHRRLNEDQLARRDRQNRLKLKRAIKRKRRAAAREDGPVARVMADVGGAPAEHPARRGTFLERVNLINAKKFLPMYFSQRTQPRCLYRRRDAITGKIKRFPNGQEVAPCGGKLKGKGPLAVCRVCGRTRLEVSS